MSFQDIDFAPQRPTRLPLLLAGALLLALAAWGGMRYLQARQAAAQALAQVQAQRGQLARQGNVASVPAPALNGEQLKAVNEAITALNLPWPVLLDALENSRGTKVSLLRVEPRPKDRLMLITAQADEMDSLVDYMRRVAQTPPFVKVLPIRQELLTDAGQVRRQASFEARWEDRP